MRVSQKFLWKKRRQNILGIQQKIKNDLEEALRIKIYFLIKAVN